MDNPLQGIHVPVELEENLLGVQEIDAFLYELILCPITTFEELSELLVFVLCGQVVQGLLVVAFVITQH